MPQYVSETSPQEHRLSIRYPINNVVMNEHEIQQLTTEVSSVANSAEIKAYNVSLSSRNERPGLLGQLSWLKKILLGSAILAGLGVAAAGTYYFQAGRREDTTGSGKMLSFHPMESSDEIIALASNMSGLPTETTSTVIPESSTSPYSYYEKTHGAKELQDKALQLNTAPPVMDKEEVTSVKDNNVYHSILTSDTPLLNEEHEQHMEDFLRKKVTRVVLQAFVESPEFRCELLNLIVYKINRQMYFDGFYKAHSLAGNTPSESHKAQQEIIRRKIAALYLAAEFIIDRKDPNFFYYRALNDKTVYTSEELMKRDNYIMSYLSVHDQRNHC